MDHAFSLPSVTVTGHRDDCRSLPTISKMAAMFTTTFVIAAPPDVRPWPLEIPTMRPS
ncbi:MAG: hypothetical protein V3T48_09320 [Vicinamibacterales bacterium]